MIAICNRDAACRALGLVALPIVLFGAGCSTFPRDWDALAPDSRPFTGIAGRWVGTWKSDLTGHEGPLRCIVTKQKGVIHSMRYRARWGGLFSFEYVVEMRVRREEDVTYFEGEEDLGWFAGGVYHYHGSASPTEFSATYESPSDAGTFAMTRPEEAPDS